MRIAYVAKHYSGGNDDEGAIHFALERLGHEVIRIQESKGSKVLGYRPDIVLFHKWYDTESIARISCPKVFWYFDLVNYPDLSLRGRCQERIRWMDLVMPLVDLGFCTDGDWVRRNPAKLIHLTQGADERVMDKGKWLPNQPPILFTGIRNGGRGRVAFVDMMRERYGDKFKWIERGTYGRRLADQIASSQIVVCPDSPVTNHYWSNRVYMAAGFQGFIIHPYCLHLTADYEDRRELLFYTDSINLHALIEHYLSVPEERERVALAAFNRTKAEHTYRHRCETLIRTIKDRLKI